MFIRDEVLEAFMKTKYFTDWVEENRLGKDHVEFIEQNLDIISKMCEERNE